MTLLHYCSRYRIAYKYLRMSSTLSKPKTPLSQQFPWIQLPLIVSAPMSPNAGPAMAEAVSRAGGIGMLGHVNTLDVYEERLVRLQTAFSKNPLSQSPSSSLPFGAGVLCFRLKMEDTVPLLAKYRPSLVWLYGVDEEAEYVSWNRAIRKALPNSQIWIQTSSVASVQFLASSDSPPDAFVIQGSDAGGHASVDNSTSFLSNLPEVADSLQRNGFGHIPLLAAGGIADARGAAAALCLGADGIVMGSRFLLSEEAEVTPEYRAKLLEASDMGKTTVKTQFFDKLKGPHFWPNAYDARGLVNKSWLDYSQNSLSIETARERYNHGAGDAAPMWAGAGIGLIRQVKPAGDIVEEVSQLRNLAWEMDSLPAEHALRIEYLCFLPLGSRRSRRGSGIGAGFAVA